MSQPDSRQKHRPLNRWEIIILLALIFIAPYLLVQLLLHFGMRPF